MTDLTLTESFLRLSAALFAGLLIGTERGWAGREAGEGQRVAGIRTFGLIGLAGAVFAALAAEFGGFLLGLGAAGLAVLLAVAYRAEADRSAQFGLTTEVAALLTFALGALAMAGHLAASSGVAVVTALLLGMKPRLHGFVARVQAEELYGTLKLLLISVVLLPVLPDRGYGPWEALNPYAIWWMVVLVAAVSWTGYVTVRLAGPHRGLMLTALAGGLVSSTAVAVNYARYARREPTLAPILAAGVVTAAATMFPRILLVGTLIQPALLEPLGRALGAMAVVAYALAFWQWRQGLRAELPPATLPMRNPFELGPALQFGLLLGLIMIGAHALLGWLGDAGVYALAAMSGLADVDAITLSLARLTQGTLTLDLAVRGILLAAFVNTLVKATLVTVIGGRAIGARVGAAIGLTIFTGAATLLVR